MASRRAERRRACERKVSYPTTEAAERACRHESQRIGQPLHFYRCSFSGEQHGHYHLGHEKRCRENRTW